MELRVKQSSYKGAALAGTIDLGDLTVNRLGFGAMRLCGDYAWGRPRDREHVSRVLRRAVELGVNFIDTADSYGPETNESLISQALYPYPPGLVIATKGGLVRPNRRSWVEDGRRHCHRAWWTKTSQRDETPAHLPSLAGLHRAARGRAEHPSTLRAPVRCRVPVCS